MSSSTTSRSPSARCAKNSRVEVARAGITAIFLAGAALAGCTTPHHQRLAEDRFEISYPNRNDLCGLLYAAELTLAAGYTHFYASHGVGPTGYSTYYPGPATTTIVQHGQAKTVACGPGLPMCGGTYVYSETPSSYEIHLLGEAPDPEEARRIVRRLQMRRQDLFVYDASLARDSLAGDANLECKLPRRISLEPASREPTEAAPKPRPPHQLPTRPMALRVGGTDADPAVLADLERQLGNELTLAGYAVAPEEPDAMQLAVEVHYFDPGSRSLRLWVGFGAGAGSLSYTAVCARPDGSVRAELDREERFTGMEFRYIREYHTIAADADDVRTILSREAARRIAKACWSDPSEPE